MTHLMTDRSQDSRETPRSQNACDHCGSGAVFATPEGLICAKHALQLIDGRDDWQPLLRTPDNREDHVESGDAV